MKLFVFLSILILVSLVQGNQLEWCQNLIGTCIQRLAKEKNEAARAEIWNDCETEVVNRQAKYPPASGKDKPDQSPCYETMGECIGMKALEIQRCCYFCSEDKP
ncbi:unnamed protein product [Bursaphelenchus xylophilus]|uniref:(pine wood nematode) hypothetical protein n=1 Tax=Bursaphelenchus xylophilus TaxID=6326 RepID=A0A1I7RVK8_BURXY|nr:unnamed protein product [Bursaphelenchus xylophilus]CAG9081821.1 unnamed protein product [Bursaphelenchus xylophilus]